MRYIKRPFLVVIIGYIIGILWGLYFKISITLFYFPIIAIYIFLKSNKKKEHSLKMFSFKRYFRYVKLFFSIKVIFIICFSSIISNSIILFLNYKYATKFQNEQQISGEMVVIGSKEEKEYKTYYKVKFRGVYLYLVLDKEYDLQFKYGDKINVTGIYKKPEIVRNEGGFNQTLFYQSKKIYGKLQAKNVKLIEKGTDFTIGRISSNILEKIENKIESLLGEEKGDLLKGILLGDTSNIKEEQKENFRISNMAHILAVSGMHVSYIVLGLNSILLKIFGKNKTIIITNIFLLIYLCITNFTPSVLRAVMMVVVLNISKIIHRKNDTINTLAFSLFLILLDNPYAITNIGLQFSYIGTIGILFFYPIFQSIFQKRLQKREKKKGKIKNIFILSKFYDIFAVMISAQIVILPISVFHFNCLGTYSIFSNIMISIFIGPVIILGLLVIITSFIFFPIAQILCVFLKFGLSLILLVSQMSELPFSYIYLVTPQVWQIVLFYILIFLITELYVLYQQEKVSIIQRRIRNLIAMLKIHFHRHDKNYKIFAIFIVLVIIGSNYIPKKLEINFIDVGQGDGTLIETPLHQTILIDGGGSEFSNFDVGRSILLPYLLDKGYNKLDYVMISHADSDHIAAALVVLEEFCVKNVVIGKQFENSENYQKFKKIVKEKNIKVHILEVGQRLKIEKDLYFDVLWPTSSNIIGENVLNNNSLVCKMVYKNFSMLFTGDIEEIAEKAMLEKYKNTNILKSTVLKVAHHGSKSSSTKEFLQYVNPDVALIGVGSNNTFGHPSDVTIDNLKKFGCAIYRTDICGEITIKTNGSSINIANHGNTIKNSRRSDKVEK